jgi:hypothetical protein
MQAEALKEGELGPVNDKEPIPPLLAHLSFNISLRVFLVIRAWEVYGLVMKGKKGYDHSLDQCTFPRRRQIGRTTAQRLPETQRCRSGRRGIKK